MKRVLAGVLGAGDDDRVVAHHGLGLHHHLRGREPHAGRHKVHRAQRGLRLGHEQALVRERKQEPTAERSAAARKTAPLPVELSHPSYRFTYLKNDNVYDGVCPECGEENAQHASYTEFGTNEKGVSVSATETISGTDAVLAVDPYRDAGCRFPQENGKPAGIEEGDIPTVLLSRSGFRARSATTCCSASTPPTAAPTARDFLSPTSRRAGTLKTAPARSMWPSN